MRRLEINYSLGAMDTMVGIARYSFVNRTIQDTGKKVLDFGCGSGYGSKVLAEKFKDLISYDIYPDGYLKPQDIEVVEDIDRVSEQKYDVITCFEVIEHMEEKEQLKLMSTLTNLLSEQGVLYISTVRKMDPPPTENRRIEHIKELSFEELYDVCNKQFNNVFTFGQVDQIISTFYKENTYHNVFICTGKK